MTRILEQTWLDLRYAVRGLRAKPAFAMAVVVTLALGIGANAAMFGIVDRMLFRPPPLLRDPATVHRIYTAQTVRGEELRDDVSQYATYLDLTSLTHSFSSTAGFTLAELAVGTGEQTRQFKIGVVSGSFFDFFSAPPVLGRYFSAAEDSTPAGAPVAVLGYGTWLTEFGGRRDVLGQRVQLGATIYTIVGVAAKGFVGLWPNTPPAYYIPITNYAFELRRAWNSQNLWWRTYSWGWMNMMARAKPHVTAAEINADLTQAFRQSYRLEIAEQPRTAPERIAHPYAFAGSILPDRGPNASPVSKVAKWLSGMAAIVLLIACANVANLFLARAIRRRREIALRLALGVSRGRLLAQLFTESLVLAGAGGVVGLLVAQLGGKLLRTTLLPQAVSHGALTDARTLLLTALVALGVGLATGLAPILQARRSDLAGDLKAGVREGGYSRSRTRAGLVVLQAALSVLLLVGAGLFVRSLSNVEAVRLGYDPDQVLLVSANTRGVLLDSAHVVQLRARMLQAAKSMPEVETATLRATIPFLSRSSTSLYIRGIDTVSRLGRFGLNAVSPEYFATMGTRVLRGRGLSASDRAGAQRVMVVSDAMAKRLWPNNDPIGECVRLTRDTMPCTYVVGVAENIVNEGYTDDAGYYYYLPADQFYTSYGGLFVRTRGLAAQSAEAVRHRLQAEVPGASYVTVTPFAEIVAPQQRSWKVGATMFVAFGALAILLAAVGLYSVITYTVQQRAHEMGVRVALGAQMGDIVRLVMSQGFALAGAGVIIGATGSLLGGRWIGPLLFHESPKDPAVFAFVACVLFVVAFAASLMPALTAARVDPQLALRSE